MIYGEESLTFKWRDRKEYLFSTEGISSVGGADEEEDRFLAILNEDCGNSNLQLNFIGFK